jgi:hypothetical protein
MQRPLVLFGVVGVGLLGVLLAPAPVVAHGGGLDGRGCHNDRKNGGYHCHRGPLAGQSFASSGDAARALDASRAPKPPGKLPPAERPIAPTAAAALAEAPTTQGPPPALKIKVIATGEGWQITNLSPGYTWRPCEAEIGNSSAKLSPMPPKSSVVVKRSEFKPIIQSTAGDMWVTCKVGGTTFTASTSQQ